MGAPLPLEYDALYPFALDATAVKYACGAAMGVPWPLTNPPEPVADQFLPCW